MGRPKGEYRSAQHEGDPVGAIIVTVAWATPEVQEVITVALAPGATVADALEASGLAGAYGLQSDALGFAVAGRRVRGSTALADRDRIDLTRPLVVDPKELRRLRAQAKPLTPGVRPPRARTRRRQEGADLP